ALSQEVEIAALRGEISDAERRAFELEIAARGDRELLLTLLSPSTDVADVISVGESQSGVGRLVWDEGQGKLYFVGTGLTPADTGKTYQIWVNRQGTWESLGTFEP